jgi:hypothetical protein
MSRHGLWTVVCMQVGVPGPPVHPCEHMLEFGGLGNACAHVYLGPVCAWP